MNGSINKAKGKLKHHRSPNRIMRPQDEAGSELEFILNRNKSANMAKLPADTQYLIDDKIDLVLSEGLNALYRTQPRHPIDYFAKWLLNNKSTQENKKIIHEADNITSEILKKYDEAAEVRQKKAESELIRQLTEKAGTNFREKVKNFEYHEELLHNDLPTFIEKQKRVPAVYVGNPEHPTRAIANDEEEEYAHLETSQPKLITFIGASDNQKFVLGKELQPKTGLIYIVLQLKEEEQPPAEERKYILEIAEYFVKSWEESEKRQHSKDTDLFIEAQKNVNREQQAKRGIDKYFYDTYVVAIHKNIKLGKCNVYDRYLIFYRSVGFSLDINIGGPIFLKIYNKIQGQVWSPVVYFAPPNVGPWIHLSNNNQSDAQRPPRERSERCVGKPQLRALKTKAQKEVEPTSVGDPGGNPVVMARLDQVDPPNLTSEETTRTHATRVLESGCERDHWDHQARPEGPRELVPQSKLREWDHSHAKKRHKIPQCPLAVILFFFFFSSNL